MTERTRLPSRWLSETLDFEHGGHWFTLSLSLFPGGGIAELFLSSALVGSPVEALARDAAVTASLAFQYGCPIQVLRSALTRDHHGGPATPLGAALDALGEVHRGDSSWHQSCAAAKAASLAGRGEHMVVAGQRPGLCGLNCRRQSTQHSGTGAHSKR
jgi:hypothetical protein